MSKKLPETQLQLIDLSPEAAEVAGRKNQINLSLSYDDVDFGKNWKRDKVGKMAFSYFVRQDHPLSGEVSFEKAKHYKFVGFTYLEKNKLITPELGKIAGQKPQRGFDSENSIYSKNIIMHSHQVAFLPLVTVLDDLRNGLIRPIKIKNMKHKTRSITLHTHLDKISNSSYKIIKEEICNSFTQLDNSKNKYLD